MLTLTLDRRWPRAAYSIGIMYVDGKRFCETLEPPDRGLTQDMPVNKIKRIKEQWLKKGEKCAIPKGRYRIDMNTISPKFKNRIWAKKYGGIVPRLVAVPCWSGELIHPGNTVDDTLSCILTGQNKINGGLVRSQETFTRLMENYLIPAEQRGDEIWIDVV